MGTRRGSGPRHEVSEGATADFAVWRAGPGGVVVGRGGMLREDVRGSRRACWASVGRGIDGGADRQGTPEFWECRWGGRTVLGGWVMRFPVGVARGSWWGRGEG